MIRLLIFIALSLWVAPAWATTYYVAANGADTNNGAAKETPWAHLPGMATCANTCAATTPTAGDTFVLKGGDTWTTANFPVTWVWSGSAGNVITLGVDATWFTGGAWARPVFDAEGVAISGPKNSFLNLVSQQYVTVSNIEIKGFYYSGAGSYGTCAMIQGSGGQNLTLDKLYIHGWSHDSYAAGGRDANCHVLLGDTNSPFMAGSVLQNSVIDGSDSTGGGDSLSTYAWPSFINNVIHDLPNMMLPLGNATISGNLLYNCNPSFDPGTHGNFLETLGGPAAGFTVYIHDNVFTNSSNRCEAAFLGNPGETDYVWNNVWYNLNENGPALVQNDNTGAGVAAYFWNNTIVPPAGKYCLTMRLGFTMAVIEFRNNHCITTAAQATDPLLSARTLSIDHNLLQTPTQATNQGYTISETFAYSPPNNNGATVRAGADLTGIAIGALAGLGSDTSYGSVLGVNHNITGPGRSTVSRPRGSAWDVGAYQTGNQPPNPPTALTVN